MIIANILIACIASCAYESELLSCADELVELHDENAIHLIDPEILREPICIHDGDILDLD